VNTLTAGSRPQVLAALDGASRLAANASLPPSTPLLLVTDNGHLRALVQRGWLAGVVGPAAQAVHSADGQAAAVGAHMGAFVELMLLVRARCLLYSESGFSITAMWCAAAAARGCLLLGGLPGDMSAGAGAASHTAGGATTAAFTSRAARWSRWRPSWSRPSGRLLRQLGQRRSLSSSSGGSGGSTAGRWAEARAAPGRWRAGLRRGVGWRALTTPCGAGCSPRRPTSE
jgi:hypothetical protein